MPGGADPVCYWFDKARSQIEAGALGAAGLVATNSIRVGKNRVVLDAIAKARTMGVCLSLDHNSSRNFQVFVQGVRRLAADLQDRP